MRVINLFGEPSCGKSTTASGLFFLMKRAGYNVELVNEYAKQLVWQERHKTFSDQLYITAKQNHRLEVLRGKVDYVISDSPLLLGTIYKVDDYLPSFENLLKELFNTYDNTNILLTRAKPYNPIGRNETEEQAQKVRIRIEKMLYDLNIKYTLCSGDGDAPSNILKMIDKIS